MWIDHSHAVIVLNRPIECEANFVLNLWKQGNIYNYKLCKFKKKLLKKVIK